MFTEDSSVLPTLHVRCTALYMLIGEWLAAQKDKRKSRMAKTYDAGASRFVTYWMALSSVQMEQPTDDRFKTLKGQVLIAKKAYYDKMMTAKTLTGHVFSDQLVKDDTLFCSKMDKVFSEDSGGADHVLYYDRPPSRSENVRET
jgi:hypothetical protein